MGNAEAMWQLSVGSGSESYPERPNEADCIYYLRTGFCGYGSRCRFNHPPDRNLVFSLLYFQLIRVYFKVFMLNVPDQLDLLSHCPIQLDLLIYQVFKIFISDVYFISLKVIV